MTIIIHAAAVRHALLPAHKGVLYFGEHLQRQKTVSGAEICSDIATLYFAEENRLFVYPNPVRQSGSFTVIINEQQSGELQVIDVNGRVLQRFVIENGGSIQLTPWRVFFFHPPLVCSQSR